MAIVAVDAVAEELPLNDERLEKKVPRHVAVALGHLNKQKAKALERFDQAEREIYSLNAAIDALK